MALDYVKSKKTESTTAAMPSLDNAGGGVTENTVSKPQLDYVKRKNPTVQQAVSKPKAETASPEVYSQKLRELAAEYDPVVNREAGQAGWNAYVEHGKKLAENTQEPEEKPLWERLLGYLGDAGPDTSLPVNMNTNQIAEGYQEQDRKMKTPDERWTEEQRYTFGYLWNTKRQKAYEYAYAVNDMLNAKAEEEQRQQIQQEATDNFGSAVGHTAGAILSAPAGGIAETLGDLIAYGTLGYVPGSDGQTSLHEYSEAVKSGVSSHLNEKGGTINENVPIVGGKGWGDVYNLGTSIAQSLLSAHTGGQAQALITAFGTAVASGIDDAKARGADDSKAIGYGVLTGTAEAFAEMIGVDNLLKIGAADTMKAVLKNILKQGAAEGLEEGITSILNNFADNLVLADKSKLNIAINDYMAGGMSREDAQKQAWLDMAEDVAYDMLGGFASGSVSGGAETVIQTAGQKLDSNGTQQVQNAPQSGDNAQAENGQESQQTTTQAQPGSLEWVQELYELGKGTNTTQQTADSGAQTAFDAYEDILARGTNAAADPVGAAVEAFKANGTVTNKQAVDILNNSKALQTLRDTVGLDLPDTAAGRRNAIKEAVARTAELTAADTSSTHSDAVEQSGVKVLHGQDLLPESQIYNWGIKKDASLGGVQPVVNDSSHGASSDASNDNIPKTKPGVNTDSKKSVGAEDSVGAAPANPSVAKVLTETPKAERTRRSLWSWVKEGVFDKGMVFENLALKTKNRELQAKWNSIRYAQSRAQWMIGNGAENTKSLNAIREEVESTGKAEQFSDYMYHRHNIDRMQLNTRYKDTKNKPVFGDSVTAEVSQKIVDKYEKDNPSFTQLADDVYAYMNNLLQMMVNNGVISRDTADLWAQMYPHYVPISRNGMSGHSIAVPLDTRRTGVNAPVKRAKGGSQDILPLFDTMAQRTLQTYTAIARNSFGVELKNTLASTVSKGTPGVDEVIDSIDAQDGLLQKGKNGENPTFTVFENGERVTFEITDEMYDALKPKSEVMSYTIKVANAVSNFHRGVLTEYNPTFLLTNAIKDVQDVLINSQHPAKTYAKIPQAYVELAKKGKWYTEYVANGGAQNTYFDSESNTFNTENEGLKRVLETPPLSTISKLNSFIEMAPRLAEYMASREAGSSIDVAMLDAARVTTNFAAGGNLTKLLNRNGATFLNASVQGAVQQVRNFREAKANGIKGWAGLAGRFVLAGLPAMLLNGLIWDDDEDYAELSDYIKDNYYIVGKYGDGQFIRIPKGRVTAVIQNAFEQVSNALTGNDDADWEGFVDLVITNLAPNNPVDSNILSPVLQVKNNETWYGEDIVPTRLQDLPAAEQYDESTDAFSKWLGEKLNISPVKINYLLDQYGGGVADTVLPMLTPKAESGDNSLVGNLLAPLKDKFTADSVMSNQNVTDFYDKLDELTTNAKARNATAEDVLKYKYFNSVNSQLSDLYTQKREVQNSDLPDDEKYEKVRTIQNEITNMAKEALTQYADVSISEQHAIVNGVRYHQNEDGEWEKIPDKEQTRYDTLAEDTATYVWNLLDGLYPEVGSKEVRPIQKIEAITGADDQLTEAEQKTALKSVLDSKAYAKYLEVLELGMSTDDYAASYRLYLDAEGSGKKAKTIEQYQKKFGVSYSTAKALYKIYSPTKS